MVLLRIQTIYLNWWMKKIITLLHSKGLLILTNVVYAIMTSVVYAIIYKEMVCKVMFFPQQCRLTYIHIHILFTINLAIVLYGWAHPHHSSSFIFCHEDTSADHLKRVSILKKYRLTKRSDRAKVTLHFKTSG